MTHKLKVFGLGLVAVFAMNALMASSVHAGEFEADEYPASATTITGNQMTGTITGAHSSNHSFATVAGTVKCTTASFHGELGETSSELTLTPTYSGCTLAGILATVDFTSCDYLLTAGEAVGGKENEIEVEAHLECPNAGEEVHIKVPGSKCEIIIEPQTLTGITAHNNLAAEPMDVVATFDVQNIKYNLKNGNKCPNAPESKTYSTGTYKGTATLAAEEPESPFAAVGMTVHAGEFEADEYPTSATTITGNQMTGTITGAHSSNHAFATVAGTVKCTTASFHGELGETSSELTLTPAYSGCSWAGAAATVDFTKCDYLLTAGETVEGKENEIEVEAHLECPNAGEEVHIKLSSGPKCEITFEPQTLTGITAHNNLAAEPMDVVATFDVQNIKYNVKNGNECPNAPESKTYTTGTYKGVTTLRAEDPDSSAAIGLRVT